MSTSPPDTGPVPPLNPVNQDSTVPIALPFTEHLEAIPPPTKMKCAAKGCSSFVPIVLIETCSWESCDKFVHLVCYEKLIASAKKNHSQIADKQFCTIKCQDLFLREIKTTAYTWTNDGRNGKADPHHSENELLAWLNTGENFGHWRDPEGAKTKLAVAIWQGTSSHKDEEATVLRPKCRQNRPHQESDATSIRLHPFWDRQRNQGKRTIWFLLREGMVWYSPLLFS